MLASRTESRTKTDPGSSLELATVAISFVRKYWIILPPKVQCNTSLRQVGNKYSLQVRLRSRPLLGFYARQQELL